MKPLSWSGLVKCPWPLKGLLLLGCLLLVPTVGYVLHGRVMIAQLQQGRALHEQVQQRWQGLAQGTEVQSVLAQVRELEGELERRRGELFDDDGLASLLQNLGRLGTGLSFEQVRVDEARAQPNFLEVPIRVRVSGHYQPLQRFLGELAGLDRLVTLRTLSLAAPGQKASGQLEMELQLQAYRAITSRSMTEVSGLQASAPRDPFAAGGEVEAGPVILDQAVLVGHLHDPDGQVAVVRVGEAVYSLREGDRFGAERVRAVGEARIELVAPERLGGIGRVLRLAAVVEG